MGSSDPLRNRWWVVIACLVARLGPYLYTAGAAAAEAAALVPMLAPEAGR